MCAIKPYIRKQLFVAICVYFGQILLSFSLAFPGRWDIESSNMTTYTQMYLTHIDIRFNSGLAIGACLFGYLSNSIGRKPCFLISGVFCFSAYLLLVHMSSIMVVVYIATFLAGLGSGIVFVGTLVYLGEIASTNMRGLLLTATNIFRYLQSYLDFAASSYIPPSFMSYFGLFASTCFFVAVFLIPESPVFFMLKGSKEALEKSLISLGREDELEAMLNTKTELQTLNKTQKDNWIEIFMVKSNRKSLFVLLSLNLLQCLSGVVGVLYLLPQFVFPIQHNISLNVIVYVTMTAGTIGAVFSIVLVEFVGRKTLLMISTGSCGVSLGILSTYLYIDIWMWSNIIWSWLLLVILVNYFFSFAIGFRIIPDTMVGEMFTPNVRSTGSAIIIFTSSLCQYFIGVLAMLILTDTISNLQLGLLFVVYCFINLVAFFFTLFLVPETKGLSLKEINDTLEKKKFVRCSPS